jgi:hypothetical protein
MNKIKTWEEYRKAQRNLLFYAGLMILASIFFFIQGGIATGIFYSMIGLLLAGMGIFPRTSEDIPMVKRWVIRFSVGLFCVLAVLDYLN